MKSDKIPCDYMYACIINLIISNTMKLNKIKFNLKLIHEFI